MIAQVRLRVQTGLNIAQAFPKGDLREAHRKKVIPRRKCPDALGIIMLGHLAPKLPMRHTRHYLREHSFAFIHAGNTRKNDRWIQIVSNPKTPETSFPLLITKTCAHINGTALALTPPAGRQSAAGISEPARVKSYYTDTPLYLRL